MFDKNSRYITRGINERLPKEIMLAIWNSIDLCNTEDDTTDYLQVFKFEKLEGEVLAIRHTQEVPERISVVYLPYSKDYEDILDETIFVIDDEDHCTMLFGYEY